ncbi:MAG: hypothetical protein CSYNP_01603 [Syntrophus sp. SKADARSKE-3]|nr:hypothetical protein [Syntrophus sp. SKADARSKE-3]
MNSDEPKISKGSGVEVDDFNSFCEGDKDPTLNKKICSLIDADSNYIVYVDDECFVQWSLTDKYGDMIPSFGAIANRLSQLETLSRTSLRKCQLDAFANLLAEGMARIIGDKDETKAHEVLGMAEAYLLARSAENARWWYIRGASLTALPSLLIACGLWFLKSYVMSFIGTTPFQVIIGALLGGIGALFFVLSRTEKIQMDPTAGSFIHYVESASRVLTGNIGAFLLALAIKANIILGFTKTSDYSFALLLVLCICAGSSERLVPGFIKRIETTVGTDETKINNVQRISPADGDEAAAVDN